MYILFYQVQVAEYGRISQHPKVEKVRLIEVPIEKRECPRNSFIAGQFNNIPSPFVPINNSFGPLNRLVGRELLEADFMLKALDKLLGPGQARVIGNGVAIAIVLTFPVKESIELLEQA